MRGRKPRPSHLKLVTGNPGKRRINKREPRPRSDLVAPPGWMNEDQVEAWGYAIEHAPAGLLTTLDRGVLVVWVTAECLHRQATEQLARSAPLVRSPNGEPMQNPLLPIINRQALIMLRAAEQLGFSPASRSRVEVEPQDPDAGAGFFDE